MNRMLFVLLLLVGTALTGCESVPKVYMSDDGDVLPAQKSSGLVARERSPIPDVPMPVGFVMLESKSKAFVNDGRRHVDHLYQGLAAKGDVVDFYRQQLGRSNWTSTSENMIGSSVFMYYTKGRETLEVRIGDRDRRVATVAIYIRDNAAAAAATQRP